MTHHWPFSRQLNVKKPIHGWSSLACTCNCSRHLLDGNGLLLAVFTQPLPTTFLFFVICTVNRTMNPNQESPLPFFRPRANALSQFCISKARNPIARTVTNKSNIWHSHSSRPSFDSQLGLYTRSHTHTHAKLILLAWPLSCSMWGG